jgi:hypothetical protein
MKHQRTGAKSIRISNDYHSDPMEITSTFSILEITEWGRQQEEIHSKYVDLSNVARDIFSIIPHSTGLEWRKFTTFWRCSTAAKTYVLPRRNLTLKTHSWPPSYTFRTQKRSSKLPGHSFNMMVPLHLHCQKDHLCQQLCLQRTSLEEELKS